VCYVLLRRAVFSRARTQPLDVNLLCTALTICFILASCAAASSGPGGQAANAAASPSAGSAVGVPEVFAGSGSERVDEVIAAARGGLTQKVTMKASGSSPGPESWTLAEFVVSDFWSDLASDFGVA
jgi:hypothetical protein